jgi:glutaredoxin-like protein NrdH
MTIGWPGNSVTGNSRKWANFSAMTKTVTVYTTPLCAPCERLKRYLTDIGVAFTVRDLMMDEAAAELMETHNIRTTPALQIGDEIIAGKDLDPERIDALLGS